MPSLRQRIAARLKILHQLRAGRRRGDAECGHVYAADSRRANTFNDVDTRSTRFHVSVRAADSRQPNAFGNACTSRTGGQTSNSVPNCCCHADDAGSRARTPAHAGCSHSHAANRAGTCARKRADADRNMAGRPGTSTIRTTQLHHRRLRCASAGSADAGKRERNAWSRQLFAATINERHGTLWPDIQG